MSPLLRFRVLEHPLAQIEAAAHFHDQIQAHVADEWGDLYSDAPPSEDTLAQTIHPREMLKKLREVGFRFETFGEREDEFDDAYFSQKYRGRALDALLYDWMFEVMDAVGLEPRAFMHGLSYSDLIFVPDTAGVAEAAYLLYLKGKASAARVRQRMHEIEKLGDELERVREARRAPGSGPRDKNPALIDRIAMLLRDAGTPMGPEDVAARLKYKNVASVTAALHQAAVYRKPKRLSGWIVRDDAGLYRWAT